MTSVSRSAFGGLDLDLLVILVALVEERSTVRAGRRLHLAQSTVSGALGRLRDALGDPLLVREGHAFEPTPRAVEVADAVRPHLLGLAGAVGEARPFDPATDARTFRVGLTDAVALTVLPALAARLRAEAPACDLVVRLGDFRSLPAMLGSGEVATALAYLRDDPPAAVKVRTLRRSPWVVVRDAASAPVDGLDTFLARPHALVSPSGELAGMVDEALEAGGLARRVALSLPGFAPLLAVLPGSDLLATVPDFVARRLGAMAPLAADPLPVELPPVPNTLAWRLTADRDPAERWFRALLADAFAAA